MARGKKTVWSPSPTLGHDPRPREADESRVAEEDGQRAEEPLQLRRHHIHDSTVQRVVTRAMRAAGVTSPLDRM